jgi:hypothetical protein
MDRAPGLFGARGQHLHEGPERVRPEDHPLLPVVRGEAVADREVAALSTMRAGLRMAITDVIPLHSRTGLAQWWPDRGLEAG